MPETKAWRLRFAKGMLDEFLDGKEVYDIRKYSPGAHGFKKGQIIEGQFLEDKEIMLLLEVARATRIKPFSKINKKEYREWGVSSRVKMMEKVREYYPDLKNNDIATLNKLRLALIDDRPIAGFAIDIPPVEKRSK